MRARRRSRRRAGAAYRGGMRRPSRRWSPDRRGSVKAAVRPAARCHSLTALRRPAREAHVRTARVPTAGIPTVRIPAVPAEPPGPVRLVPAAQRWLTKEPEEPDTRLYRG